jgi:hypothetical protein
MMRRRQDVGRRARFITDFVAPVDGIRRRSRRRKSRLRRRLNDGQWQSLDALRNSIHWDNDEPEGERDVLTLRLLTSIGARQNEENLWSLGVPIIEFGQVSKRATFLYEQAGSPAGHNHEFRPIAEQDFYEKGGKIYLRDGSQNIKEALGFTKDWVTSLIGLDTAAIGAIGAFISLKDFPTLPLSWFEWALFSC